MQFGRMEMIVDALFEYVLAKLKGKQEKLLSTIMVDKGRTANKLLGVGNFYFIMDVDDTLYSVKRDSGQESLIQISNDAYNLRLLLRGHTLVIRGFLGDGQEWTADLDSCDVDMKALMERMFGAMLLWGNPRY